MKIKKRITIEVDTDKIELIADKINKTIKIVDFNKEPIGIELFHQQVGIDFDDFWCAINVNGIMFDINYYDETGSSALYELHKKGNKYDADYGKPIKIKTTILK